MEIIDPSGTLYTGVGANSEYNTSYAGQNMFDTDVSFYATDTKLEGADWARIGAEPGYLAFQLDATHVVGSVYYAQRAGNNAVLDKITKLSIWADANTPFAPSDPGTPPSTVVAVTQSGGALWSEYLFTNNIAGRYFLVKVEQSPSVGGNIGGNELRLGQADLSAPPAITIQPSARTLYPGGTIRLNVKATGTAPLHYQWKLGATSLSNDSRISGVDGTDLIVSNVTVSDMGTYTCTITNVAGKVVSDAAIVTVLANENGFGGAVISNNPVGFWRLDEASGSYNAHDAVNSLDGAYGVNAQAGVDGPRKADFAGFSSTNTAVGITGYTVDSTVTLPSLALYTNTVTLLAWINPQGAQQPYTGIVFNRNPGTTAGLIFSEDGTKLGYQWNGAHYDFDSGLTIPTEQWSMVALSITSTNATLYLGANNQLSSRVDLSTYPNQYFTGTTYVGLDTDVGESARTFNGMIDDVAIFNRALTPAEIQTLYTTAVETVQVTPAEVTVQPVSQNLIVGEPFALTPVVVGSLPITYQWFTSNGPVSQATNLAYNIASAKIADAGYYYLVASNKAGAVTSSTARVTVLSQSVGVLDPTGAIYSEISASSEYPSGGYEAVNLFNTDVSHISIGSTVDGSGWAENGADPAFVAFQLDKTYPVQAIFYAQRAGDTPTLDKVTQLSVWASATEAFDPFTPPETAPDVIIPVTVKDGALWSRYLFADAITGRYFLIKAEQSPKSGGNIGGSEIRLGVVVTPQSLQWSWSKNGLILTWTQGQLQVADTVTGPWTTASDISSGTPIPANSTQKFYRLKY